MQTSPFFTLPPKGESLECYKLTGREHYKLTNSKLPKEDTPSEQGTERTLSRELSHSHTEHFRGKKSVMQPGPSGASPLVRPPPPGWSTVPPVTALHLLQARPGQLSTLRTLPSEVSSLKYSLYSGQRGFSHTFKLSSQRAADNVTIGFLLTCVSLVQPSPEIFFPRLLLKSPPIS